MIRNLFALSDRRGRIGLTALIVVISAGAVLQGFGFVLLAPYISALIAGDAVALTQTTWWLGVTWIAYALCFVAGSVLGGRSATHLVRTLLTGYSERIAHMPLAWFGRDRTGETTDITTRGIVFVAAAPYAILRPILTAVITPAVVLASAFWIEWRLALLLALAAPLSWLSYRWISRRIAHADHDHVGAVGKASARIVEFARTQPALRAAADNRIATELVQDALSAQHDTHRRIQIAGGTGLALFGLTLQLAVAVLALGATALLTSGSISIGACVAILVLAVRFSEPLIHSGLLGGGLAIAGNTLTHIRALDEFPRLPEPLAPATPAHWAIEFRNVSFGYGTNRPVVDDVSFTAPAAQLTAIVGPSGAGKTTLTRLISRHYDPERGAVLLGDQPLTELGSAVVAAAVAPVPQQVYLLNASIRENILSGNPGASEAELLAAAQAASVTEIVERLPRGWDTPVGEAGGLLSGGERQRVAIARALIANAPIVVLDEVTAALDAHTEASVHTAIEALRADRTLIVVAHRLHTIAGADHIVMLDQAGRVSEQGTHTELLARGGHYASFWHARNASSTTHERPTPFHHKK